MTQSSVKGQEDTSKRFVNLLELCDMRSSSLLLLSFLVGVCDVQGASGFRICAFNLQHFGDSKSKKSTVMHTLTREVRDSKGKALPQLLTSLNRYDSEHVYDAVASERLGRTESYQEQYVFVYRTDAATVTGQYQYPDDKPGDVDAFAREPFVVRFKAPRTGQFSDAVKDDEMVMSYKHLTLHPTSLIRSYKGVFLIPQHTTPTNTTKELDALYDVLQHVKKMWKTENVMLLGDFNADCGYLAKKNRKNVRLITQKDLLWLIPEKTDTTVRSSTSCTYDRIVVNGETFARAVVPLSAKPFNFQMEYRLTEEQALEVSDHYPVEVLLKTFQNKLILSNPQPSSILLGLNDIPGPQSLARTGPAQLRQQGNTESLGAPSLSAQHRPPPPKTTRLNSGQPETTALHPWTPGKRLLSH
ncbi:Deoxyribonuclease gamma [Collichthys lucidus]|uniref:Deoxyribonuclease-1-like 1 n=1 Tax=Collichthys lucidus TaxID=240159 RepID=A0A4U5UR40_COLLU|nr:Deoxyribonuclease gamma [Collichthys lucidus]